MTDPIDQLLDMMRVRSTAYLSKNLRAPWGVEVERYETLARFHLIVTGQTWIRLSSKSEPHLLRRGDIAIVPRGCAHHYFYDRDQVKYVPRNYPYDEGEPEFAPLYPDSSDTHMLCGYFEISDNTPTTIMDQMPDILVNSSKCLKDEKRSRLLIDLATEELSNPTTGFQIRLNRITEMICVQTIQSWLESAIFENDYLRALGAPKTALVLDAIHNDPDREWTVAELAQIYGQSRSAFNARFKLATGQSPMHYLRNHRLKRARGLLTSSGMSIDEIAFKSGYADTNAFNRAFKRAIGKSPGQYRRQSGT